MWLLMLLGMLTFEELPVQRGISDPNPVYVDVMSYAVDKAVVSKYKRLDNLHETIHKMSGHHRVRLKPSLGRNSFYIPFEGMIVLREPGIKKSQVAAYVPRNLRSSRFSLYVQGQTFWNDAPLYICDEWNAYLANDECYVIDEEMGLYDHSRYLGVSNCLQFAVYSVALYNAVKDKDPQYLKDHPEFKDFVYLQLHRTQEVLKRGMEIDMFSSPKSQYEYHKKMMDSPIGETLNSDFQGILTEFD